MFKQYMLVLSLACYSVAYGNENVQTMPVQVASFSHNNSQKMPFYINIFAHGLGGTAGSGLKGYKEFIGGFITGKNGPEWNADLYGKYAGPLQSSLAQEADIAVVADQIVQYPHAKLILSGVSKGAATMVNTVGWLAVNNPLLLERVAAVIVESPFDSMESAAANMMHTVVEKFGSAHIATDAETTLDSYCVRPLGKYFERVRFKNYKSDGISPIKAVREMWPHVNKNMVVVFVHSQEDEVISVNASRILYATLKEHGFQNLYYIETEKGAHANVFWGADKKLVLEQLCYIYIQHGLPLPHEMSADVAELLLERFEKDSKVVLAAMQPTVGEINARVHPWLSKVIGPKGFKLLGYVK
jgi:hypothetical protein